MTRRLTSPLSSSYSPHPNNLLWLLFTGASVLPWQGTCAAETKCYDTWGNEDPDQQPCLSGSSDTATWCCRKTDQCLTNGLCLSPGLNNLMTQQGCTDKNWGAPCIKFCSSKQQDLGVVPLLPCPSSFDARTGAVKFCCGPEATSCCATPSLWITIATATAIPSRSSSSSASNQTLKIGLGIGLGIGIPILLVLLGVLYLLCQPVRRRGYAKSSSRGGTSTNGGDKNRRRRGRRQSFGDIDTNPPPASDDEANATGRVEWADQQNYPPPPPATIGSMGSWRSAFQYGFHHHQQHQQPPPSPRELDAEEPNVRSRKGGGLARFRAELPADNVPKEDRSVSRQEGKGNKVPAENVELPTPDRVSPPPRSDSLGNLLNKKEKGERVADGQ